jgi:hypothetical protein
MPGYTIITAGGGEGPGAVLKVIPTNEGGHIQTPAGGFDLSSDSLGGHTMAGTLEHIGPGNPVIVGEGKNRVIFSYSEHRPPSVVGKFFHKLFSPEHQPKAPPASHSVSEFPLW